MTGTRPAAACASSTRVSEYVEGYLAVPEDTVGGDALAEAWADGMEPEAWE